jgi:hypothetical protein
MLLLLLLLRFQHLQLLQEAACCDRQNRVPTHAQEQESHIEPKPSV